MAGAYVRLPVGWTVVAGQPAEESPGSMETRWRLTAAGGDPRDSATENKPPLEREFEGKGETVR